MAAACLIFMLPSAVFRNYLARSIVVYIFTLYTELSIYCGCDCMVAYDTLLLCPSSSSTARMTSINHNGKTVIVRFKRIPAVTGHKEVHYTMSRVTTGQGSVRQMTRERSRTEDTEGSPAIVQLFCYARIRGLPAVGAKYRCNFIENTQGVLLTRLRDRFQKGKPLEINNNKRIIYFRSDNTLLTTFIDSNSRKRIAHPAMNSSGIIQEFHSNRPQ